MGTNSILLKELVRALKGIHSELGNINGNLGKLANAS